MMRNLASRALSSRPMRYFVIAIAMLCGCAASKNVRQDSPPRSVVEETRRDPLSWQDIKTTSRGDLEESSTMASISSAPAVRHRRLSRDAAGVVAEKVGGLFAGPAIAPVAQVLTAATPKEPEKLVIEAWIDLKIDDVTTAAAEIRARVEADGGRVVSENIIGPAKAASSAAIEIRIPPEKAALFQTWLATRGIVESRRVLASDVSKTLFDQELALKNLEVTMGRLQKLAEKDVPMKELIEIENEMTRVRGQIERIKGEHRFLLDRVAFATITLTLTREGGPIEFAPHARIHPGPHFSTMTLLDPEGRPRSRVGGGVTIHIKRYFTFDLDAFPAKGGDTRIIVGTIGTALYSSFLGNGRRKFGNPYLGARVGYGFLSDEEAAVVGGEIGLELYKHKYLQISAAVRAIAFFRDERTDVALHGQFGFEVPF